LRSIGFPFSFRQKIGVREHPPLSRMAAQAPYPGYPPLTLKTRQTSHSRAINHIKIMSLGKYFLT
ncbi:hypothetical protein AAIG33_19775, partial [Phytobacter ursingii]|uniref:hypothetical protein n=1 Tax=Phytobacter ursingii TaxID=1972431 RepID=UPI0031B7822C